MHHKKNPSCSPIKDKSTCQGAPQASWTAEDVNILLDLAIAHRSSAGGGMNFKSTFWNLISTALLNPTKGGPKSARVYKERWKRMCNYSQITNHCANIDYS